LKEIKIQYDELFIIDQFTKMCEGTLKVIELNQVNTISVISDIYSDPYTKMTLYNKTTIKRNGRLKLYVEIREPVTERDTSIVVNLSVKNGIIEQVTKFETHEFDTLPNEADNTTNKIIDPKKLLETNIFLLKCIQVIISIMNAIINSENWKIIDGN